MLHVHGRTCSRCVGAVLAAILLSHQPARGQETEQFEPVRQRIAKALADTNVPSIAVAVARDGKIIWEQGFGWADRENRVPASEHTLYSLASISKPITATGLMVLKERGKIDLDKPVNDYLGEAKLTNSSAALPARIWRTSRQTASMTRAWASCVKAPR